MKNSTVFTLLSQSVSHVVIQTAICPLSPFNVDVYGLECKNQPVNVTLMGGRRRGTLLIALMRFTCCSSEVLQLFMTKIVAGYLERSRWCMRILTFNVAYISNIMLLAGTSFFLY